MARDFIKIDAGDVYIRPIPVEMCERCGEDDSDPSKYAGVPATKIVTLDLRGNGQEITVGVYCDKCAGRICVHSSRVSAQRSRSMSEITELAETYCNNATESLREGDPAMASARAQVAIALNLQRIADSIDELMYDRGDGTYYLRVENAGR